MQGPLLPGGREEGSRGLQPGARPHLALETSEDLGPAAALPQPVAPTLLTPPGCSSTKGTTAFRRDSRLRDPGVHASSQPPYLPSSPLLSGFEMLPLFPDANFVLLSELFCFLRG